MLITRSKWTIEGIVALKKKEKIHQVQRSYNGRRGAMKWQLYYVMYVLHCHVYLTTHSISLLAECARKKYLYHADRHTFWHLVHVPKVS